MRLCKVLKQRLFHTRADTQPYMYTAFYKLLLCGSIRVVDRVENVVMATTGGQSDISSRAGSVQ